MRGTVAKRLRKQAKFVKNRTVVVDGEYNLRIGSGEAAKVIIVQKTKPAPESDEYKAAFADYREAKAEYYKTKK